MIENTFVLGESLNSLMWPSVPCVLLFPLTLENCIWHTTWVLYGRSRVCGIQTVFACHSAVFIPQGLVPCQAHSRHSVTVSSAEEWRSGRMRLHSVCLSFSVFDIGYFLSNENQWLQNVWTFTGFSWDDRKGGWGGNVRPSAFTLIVFGLEIACALLLDM